MRPLSPSLSPSDGERVSAGRVRGTSSGSLQPHASGILKFKRRGSTRRRFLRQCAVAGGTIALGGLAVYNGSAADARQAEWLSATSDPFRDELLRTPKDLPDRVRLCAEPLRGEPAFAPELIERFAAKIPLPSGARLEHPLLERAVRVGLAHIEATFQGEHPKYGVGTYAKPEHDGFPPTIIATVDALSLWGLTRRAEQLFGYWLDRFVRSDGTIGYYGPSLGEYGQLLTTARRLMQRGGSRDWLAAHRDALVRLARHLESLLRQHGPVKLVDGVPEADERKQVATYFHNNAWMVRGLEDWVALTKTPSPHTAELRRLLLGAIHEVWPRDPADWWLSPTVQTGGFAARPQGKVTANRFGSYANYRYWPELLSSGVLPRELMQRIVKARLTSGGQFCGMTRFAGHLDDWPLMDYLEGLWSLGRRDDYRLSLWGHICFHQAEGHLTAYEQVSLPPGRKVADYCLPSQLVAVRAARKLT